LSRNIWSLVHKIQDDHKFCRKISSFR